MNENLLMDAVERYIRGEMTPDERLQFEQLRKTNADVDQMVVEHTLFLQQMNRFNEWQRFRHTLNEVHTELAEAGQINASRPKGTARLVYLWNRYKRVTAIAASIAGVTALTISALVLYLNPPTPQKEVELLNRRLHNQENLTNRLSQEITRVKNRVESPYVQYKTGGTSFLIDGKGFLITNFHVIDGATNIAVINRKGDGFAAGVVYSDPAKDLAILKISDTSYHSTSSVPYAINRNSADLAEPVFTLGYPRDEIVYGQGYLSALTGYNGDTLSCQIEVAANRGNSGSPILNQDGEVIGILNGRQTNAEGFVFATHSRFIYDAVDSLRKADTTYQRVKINPGSSIKGLDRVQQVKKIEDFVYMVKVN